MNLWLKELDPGPIFQLISAIRDQVIYRSDFEGAPMKAVNYF